MVSMCSVLKRKRIKNQNRICSWDYDKEVKDYNWKTGCYLMRLCAEVSTPCSCLTVAAEDAIIDKGTADVTEVDGPVVPEPGSVFTTKPSVREENVF